MNNVTTIGLLSNDFKKKGCNYNIKKNNEKGICIFEGNFRTSCVTCEAECQTCAKKHIGSSLEQLIK